MRNAAKPEIENHAGGVVQNHAEIEFSPPQQPDKIELANRALTLFAKDDFVDVGIVFENASRSLADLHCNMRLRESAAKASEGGRRADQIADMFSCQYDDRAGGDLERCIRDVRQSPHASNCEVST